MDKKQVKQWKLSKENATKEFNQIVEAFGFTISTDVKERVLKMTINAIEMETSQELNDADTFIQKIMEGKISFDAEKTEIVYKLKNPVMTGEQNQIRTDEIRFREFTRAMQKSTGVPLKECNFATMNDEKTDAILMAMTGTSDIAILNGVGIQELSDLCMIGGYFFG